MRHSIISLLTALIVVSTIPFALSYESATGTVNNPLADFTLPNWIKSNAGWWADDLIDDSSFVSGLQWMISNDVIVLPPTEQGTDDGENIIPRWVKSTAGWWADDKIHDVTFASAVKYLVSEGIIVIEQEVEETEESVENVELKEFHMIVNSHGCTFCTNWANVGEEYHFQIETLDEFRGNNIDGVTITAKIISKDGELRHDFGTITTEDGIYSSSIVIPNMDWYAGNIFSVTAAHNGFEKTIEKEFEVFNVKSGKSGTFETKSYGKKMFVAGNEDDDINEYTLATAWDVSSASFVDSFSVASQDTDPRGVAFSNNGQKMFVVGNQGNDINEYTLATAWDVSSASFVDSFSIDSQEASPRGIAFSNNGQKMFVAGHQGKDINEYTLATAWDVSSASFVDSFSVESQDRSPRGVAFSNNGQKMFVVGAIGDAVYEYTLTTAWDVSSASFVDSFSVASQDTVPRGVAFSNNGQKMFVAGNEDDDINEYTLATAWDVSSASFVDSFSISSQDNTPTGLFL